MIVSAGLDTVFMCGFMVQAYDLKFTSLQLVSWYRRPPLNFKEERFAITHLSENLIILNGNQSYMQELVKDSPNVEEESREPHSRLTGQPTRLLVKI